MEGNESVCFVGKFCEDECFGDLKAVSELSQEELELIVRRSNLQSLIEIADNAFICNKHIGKYILWYSMHRKVCCDIFKRHKSKFKAGLQEVTLEEAKMITNSGLPMVLGEMMCSDCRTYFRAVCGRFDATATVEETNGMEGSSTACCVGKFVEEECSGALKALNNLTQEEQELILWRSNLQSQIQITDKTVVCVKHIGRYLLWFSNSLKVCCDVFKLHRHAIHCNLREMTLEEAKKLRNCGFQVIPGMKVCPTCIKRMRDVCRGLPTAAASSSSLLPLPLCVEGNRSSDLKPVSLAGPITTSANSVASSVESHSAPRHTRRLTALRKCEAVALQMESCEKCGTVINNRRKQQVTDKGVEEKARHFDYLMNLIKEKIKYITNREKIQLLTLVPESWSGEDVGEMFGVSELLVCQARALAAEKGVAALPEKRKAKVVGVENNSDQGSSGEKSKKSRERLPSKDKIVEGVDDISGDGSSREKPKKRRKTKDTIEGDVLNEESSRETPGERNEELVPADEPLHVHLKEEVVMESGGEDSGVHVKEGWSASQQLQSTSAFTFIPVKEEFFESCDSPPEAAGSQDFLEAECVLKDENGWTSLDTLRDECASP